MTPLVKGLAVGAIQVLLVAGIGAKFLYDRSHYPRLWVETYQTPTWVEYIRHNQRRTKADADSVDRLRELHRGDQPPRVERRIIRQATRFSADPHPKAPIDHP